MVALIATNALIVVILAIQSRRVAIRVGNFDVAVLALWIAIRAFQAAVFSRNGFFPDGAGEEVFVTRGWFARDTLYFYALVEQAMQAGGWPEWNPFFGGFEIAYPRLVHVGLAGLLTASGERIATAASGLMGVVLLPIVSLGLSVAKSAVRRSRRNILWPMAAGFLFYALALRFDLVLYPHTQYFVLGVFLLFSRVMVVVGMRPFRRDWTWISLGWALALFLILAHQVSGSAALFAWVLMAGVLGRARRWPLLGWGVWVAASAALVVVLFSGGRDPHLRPHTAGFDWYILGVWIRSLRGWVPALLLTVWTGLVLRRMRPQVWSSAGLLVVALCVLVWGVLQEYVHSRIILVFNAERYLYHGFLLVFPAVAILFSEYWNRCAGRRGMHVILVVLMLLPFFQLPALTYKSGQLLSEEPHVVSSDALRAYGWVAENTDVGDVFLQTPARDPSGAERFDRSLPAITGRTLYIADVYNIWGYANIPAYEHRARVEFVRRVSEGRYRPEALARDCIARGIDYILIRTDGPPNPSIRVLRSQRFRTVYEQGNVAILRPAPSDSGSNPR
jgi:hypothetical protein